MSTCRRIKTKLDLFWEAISLPEIRNILFYVFIVSICAPNLEEFLIYYNESMMVTPLLEGYAQILLFVFSAIFFMAYNHQVSSKAQIHPSAVFATLMRVVCSLFFAYDVTGRYPAGKTLLVQAVAIRSFVDAFLYFSAIVYFSKMVPHHVEGMMIGFIKSLIMLIWDVFARLFTVGLN